MNFIDQAVQVSGADKAMRTVTAAGDGVGQKQSADKAIAGAPAPSPLIDHLAELQVRRKFYISTVNKQTNAAKALTRRILGWRYDDDEDGREKINARAARIVAAAMDGREQKPEDAPTFGLVHFTLARVAEGIEPYVRARGVTEKDMKRAARDLPVYPWAKAVHGLGELGLAVIVAEAGDLGAYPKKGHLWKRLGLAPHDGHAYSTWRRQGGLNADEWTEAGYSPRRRAEIFAVVSEPLFRAQTVAQGPYRAIYDRRREATAQTHSDWTRMHSHMDALRIMTKHLIRDLRAAWREANVRLP